MAQVVLDQVTHRKLLALRAREQEIERELSKAEKLGIDMSAFRAQFDEAKRIRQVLIENYGPNGISLEDNTQ